MHHTASELYSICLSFPKAQRNRKQEFHNAAFITYQFLILHSVCEMVLVFLRRIANYYRGLVRSWHIHILTRKRRKLIIISKKGKKRGSINSPTALCLGQFAFSCAVEKNRLYYNFFLNISAQKGRFDPCFQTTFPFLVNIVKLGLLH